MLLKTNNERVKMIEIKIKMLILFQVLDPLLYNVQNGQTHFKNFAKNAARFIKCVWPLLNIMHERVKTNDSIL